MTSDRVVLGTRKGLLVFEKAADHWRIVQEAHLGARVPYAVVDPRSETLFACLDHGHWGSKLQRSGDLGKTWEEIPAPKYPEGALLKEFWAVF